MKNLPFWLMFSLLVVLSIILFGMSPASADTPPPPNPVVKIGPASKVLVKTGQPYIALRLVKPATPWPSRWDIRKPRH